MLFRQFFDHGSSTYTYLIASRIGGEALLIDTVIGQLDQYLTLLKEMDLKLVQTVDTHTHADHVTAMGKLRDKTRCMTVMGEKSQADVVSSRVREGEYLFVEGIKIKVLYTPGHTDDSYSFLMNDRVFTGDTLLIRSTGRTDFQNGDAGAQYDSIFGKLLKLPDETLVYPAHDYKGCTVSSISEERAHNPRLQVTSQQEYIDVMNKLSLPRPKLIDTALPANRQIGLPQAPLAKKGIGINVEQLRNAVTSIGTLLVDLRSDIEENREGSLEQGIRLPYKHLEKAMAHNGSLRQLILQSEKTIFVCSFGELAALATQTALEAGLTSVHCLIGGTNALRNAGMGSWNT